VAACERLARSASSPETREIMRYLAMRWRTLAEEDEAKLRPSEPEVRARAGSVADAREDGE
jgi:hypothetical protein